MVALWAAWTDFLLVTCLGVLWVALMVELLADSTDFGSVDLKENYQLVVW